MPREFAASRMVLPSGTRIDFPSIIRFIIVLLYNYCILRAHTFACTATYALFMIDLMLLIGTELDRAHGTALGADGTADAFLSDPVMYKRLTLARRAVAGNMSLILFTEMLQGR